MFAAFGAAYETVGLLLSKGASPDLMDNDGYTALVVAIQSSCPSTISLLAPVTRKGLGQALASHATHSTQVIPAVEDLLRRAALDEDAVRMGLAYAVAFGASGMLKILTKGWSRNTLLPSYANHLLHDALQSDNAETVQIILALVRDVSSENIALALGVFDISISHFDYRYIATF